MPTDDGGPRETDDVLTNQSPTAELTALAAHLRRVSDRLDQLAELHSNLSELVAGQILPDLQVLRRDSTEQLNMHTEQLRQLVDSIEIRHSQPVNWTTLNRGQAEREWEPLADWIEYTLVPWYEITREQLPDCWALHRPVVIELSWLRAAHHEAYRGGAAAHESADWHTRWLPAALTRIRAVIPQRGLRTCGPGQHLLSEHERTHSSPGPPTQPTGSADREPMPGGQLAERHHWQSFYQQAVSDDLGWRHPVDP